MQFFSDNTINELPLVLLVVGVVIIGLWISNILYDLGVPNYISRKIGHGAGGLAFLVSFAFSSPAWPIIVAAGLGALLLVARLVRPETFRGVGGAGRSKTTMAEVWFAWIALPVFSISWLWLNKPEVAVTSLLFMAWGDGVTGLVRSQVYHRQVKGWWGSLAMLIVCLSISWVFIRPYWIGVAGSLIAVITEWVFGDNGVIKWADDNWAIPVTSLASILILLALTGAL